MNLWPLRDGGWTLVPAVDSDFDDVMLWFPDAAAVDIWGGPNFRYPFTGETFREDCRVDVMKSYLLRDSAGELAAFGQSCERDGRGHMARLVANPGLRRHGAGSQLIRMIIAALEMSGDYDEYSLFVYQDNTPAYECYLSLGFAVVEYPDDAPMPDKCFFLTRKSTRREE